jgi:dipeptidyl aminopeptidase/acylaminoacyl peptidase
VVRTVTGNDVLGVTPLPADRGIVSIDWAPAGDRIAFLWNLRRQRGIETLAVPGGDPVPAVHDEPLTRRLGATGFVWMPDGRIVYVTYGARPMVKAVRVDPATGAAVPAPAGTPWLDEPLAVEIDEMSVSLDGRVAYTRIEDTYHVWVGDLGDGALSNVTRLTKSGVRNVDPAWTADSSAVLFARFDGSGDIHRQALGPHADAVLVAHTEGRDSGPQEWGRGEGTIFYNGKPGSTGEDDQLVFAPPGGVNPRVLSDAPPGLVCRPDAGCVARVQKQAHHEFRTFDPETGIGPAVASLDGWRDVQFDLSFDGRTIVVTGTTPAGEPQPMRFIDIPGGGVQDVKVDSVDMPRWVAWSTDGRHVFATTTSAGRFRLLRIARDGSAEVLRESPNEWMTGVAVSPDGRHLAFQVEEIDTDVWLGAGI